MFLAHVAAVGEQRRLLRQARRVHRLAGEQLLDATPQVVVDLRDGLRAARLIRQTRRKGCISSRYHR